MGRCIYLRKGEVHTPPVVGIKAGDLPVGQIVKLMEGGVETEFIVVNQGLPQTASVYNTVVYDSSCNGTWLLRSDIKELRKWNNTLDNTYSSSSINTWLNGDYFNSLGAVEQTVVKQVKIPYINGDGYASDDVASGANGLSVKTFLLGAYELGWTNSDSGLIATDGIQLEYFGYGEKQTSIPTSVNTSYCFCTNFVQNQYQWSREIEISDAGVITLKNPQTTTGSPPTSGAFYATGLHLGKWDDSTWSASSHIIYVPADATRGRGAGYTIGYSPADETDDALYDAYFCGNGWRATVPAVIAQKVTADKDTKRIAYLDGTATRWWSRSAQAQTSQYAWLVNETGGRSPSTSVTLSYGIRPCLIIPSTSIFDRNTYVLLGGGQVTRHLL